nr:GNAT family N-acetyltransferase [Anabaena lutea]
MQCFPIIKQLRPHLTEQAFIKQVQRQRVKYGYTLCYLEDLGKLQCVAGFRISECLCDGKYLYVDDLVTDELQRSLGYGEKVFEWLVNYARVNGCNEIGLESGVQRFAAHRFYMKQRMRISSSVA